MMIRQLTLSNFMEDKLNRARRLAKAAFLAEASGQDTGPAIANEPIDDTLRDLANYALIAQVEAGRETA